MTSPMASLGSLLDFLFFSRLDGDPAEDAVPDDGVLVASTSAISVSAGRVLLFFRLDVDSEEDAVLLDGVSVTAASSSSVSAARFLDFLTKSGFR